MVDIIHCNPGPALSSDRCIAIASNLLLGSSCEQLLYTTFHFCFGSMSIGSLENSCDSDLLDSGLVCAHSHHHQNNSNDFGELVFLKLESVTKFTSI